MRSLEDITHNQRWLRRHPAEKAFLAFGLLAVSLLADSWPARLFVFLLSAGLLLFSARIRPRSYFSLLLLPLSFLVAGSVVLFIGVDFNAGPVPKIGLVPGAWRTALPLVTRSMAAFNCLLLFALTTPLADAMHFFRRCGLPAEVLEAALLTYNMFAVLYDSMANMYVSQQARLGYSGLATSYRSLGMLAGNLLVKALDRSKHLEIGLMARGYDGRLTVLVEFAPVSWARVGLTAALLAALAFAMKAF